MALFFWYLTQWPLDFAGFLDSDFAAVMSLLVLLLVPPLFLAGIVVFFSFSFCFGSASADKNRCTLVFSL